MKIEDLIMSLIVAIQDDDLENTKRYVEEFNNSYDSLNLETNIGILLDIHSPETYGANNKSIEYVLLHMKGLNDAEVARWNRKRYSLLNSKENIPEIEAFIQDQLQNKTYNINNNLFVQGLIQLAVRLNDRLKTAAIFEQLKTII
jgi:hypothetical protein